MNKARQTILRLVSEGKITVEEADELMDAIESSPDKNLIGDFVKNKMRSAGEQAKEQARQAREQARRTWDQARRKWHEEHRGTNKGDPFEFNFPWDQPDWQWPWDRQDWQWPWEQSDWQWPWDKPGTGKSASMFEVSEESILNVKNDGGDMVIIGTDDATLKITGQDPNRKVQREGKIINILSAGSDFTIEVPVRVSRIDMMQSGGDLRCENPRSDMAIRIVGGDLSMSGTKGKIQISSEGGDIHLADINSNEIEARANSGDISLNMLPGVEKGSIILNADSGDVSLMLPPGSKCQISANTTNGEINHTLRPADSVEIVEETKTYLNAKLNGGGAEFIVATKTGDINIKA
jgi:hypothetical protein